MKLRRLAALVSAAVLALGMVTAVSASPAPRTNSNEGCNNDNQPEWCATSEPTEAPTGEPTKEPTSEPTEDASVEPTEDASVEPTEDASVEPTEDASVEPTEDASEEPTDEEEDGEVEALTSEPTLPPTDALSGDATSGPDGTLPLVLIVLGVIGLAAVVLTPARAKR